MHKYYAQFPEKGIQGRNVAALGLVTRRRRLEGADGRVFLLALDHGLPSGPVPGIERPADLLCSLRGIPFSGVVANPGMVRFVAGEIPPSAGLVVHLSASTVLGARPRSKVLSSTVEYAVSLGADAVSVQISFGDSLFQASAQFAPASALPAFLRLVGKSPLNCRKQDFLLYRFGEEILRSVPHSLY